MLDKEYSYLYEEKYPYMKEGSFLHEIAKGVADEGISLDDSREEWRAFEEKVLDKMLALAQYEL